ncbi:sensor histidine kinase [Fibrella forsythiae]|uniref:Histidine kinase n=1 Tax=Fibrella forsythiae TaxID=2817061 RepID=A0ABS3JRE6_9BACT|nr:histidine kinase [Fibrella forsythiae]MBO0952580.1 histidine kinase [Fibrella forsythiae]
MPSFFPTYAEWILLFIGATTVILIANLIQWMVRRERIYGLYTLYILLWLLAFGLDNVPVSPVKAFIHTVNVHMFAWLYLEIAITFLQLKTRPALLRWYRIIQKGILIVALPEVYFNLFSSAWQTQWHETQLNGMRVLVVSMAYLTILYTVIIHVRSTDLLARFFIAGTLALWITQLIGIFIISHYANAERLVTFSDLPSPIHPGFLIQFGILLDMASVSLGLSYRQQQRALQQVRIEQGLIREREQHLRQQLQSDLALQHLKQQRTEAQMRALQSQVNPHFLFNALNTLSALIDENPRQATEYVDELSSVYRYLLRSADQELTPLNAEMAFIKSYFFLLTIRFGDSVCPELNIASNHYDALIPPLTLQLLVENAVKHNRVLPNEPLTIRIRTTGQGYLVVENNMQRRNVRVESNGVGLNNIADKYRLLGSSLPLIEEKEGWFRVTLPLLPATQLIDNDGGC